MVYWPNLTKEVDYELKPCLACQATEEGKHHKDKLTPSLPPEKPWSKIGADHWGPLPDGSGRHILVLQDYLTKYPEALVVKNTAAEANIRALEEVFGRHGYPIKMRTDNGPPWNGVESHAMQQYLKWAGVQHDPTKSADDPEANGLAERLMQLVGKSWETAMVEGTNPIASLNAALKSYRNTEHSVTGRKPAEWLFGRAIRTRLPDYRMLQTQHEDDETTKAKQKMIERGEKDKIRRDKRDREEELAVGMKVLLKNKKKKKGQPRYDPKPYTITKLKGRQATLQRGNKTIRRETQKFKRFFENPPLEEKMGGRGNKSEDEWEQNLTPRAQGKELAQQQAADNTRQEDSSMAAEEEAAAEGAVELAVEAADMREGQNQAELNEWQTPEAESRRTSDRERRPREMYGEWDTSQRRKYSRR